ncbi:glycoside hydrolase family 3 N-terminal domain-containing protein [Abyssalbus ytuae]|uniref:beta-glucosidase n=1 Tax=Abyssalbus ytuae TaxID=2926907 RepID=A0A9E6ZZY6_9FLAO|nr:glycoside hydrolase family 3 N-terminal domain-containing protein [Abyssalbus ytuae]UOB17046.1 glycoside hydrolase family 3 C-terminal domain-containing protein [Abyssalbus ytuae]
MKKILYLPLISFFIVFNSCKDSSGKNGIKEDDTSNEISQKVAELVNEMTLEEKVGQMTQLNISVFFNEDSLDHKKLKYHIIEKGLGSILNTPFNSAYSLENWRNLNTLIQDYAKESRTKIPLIYGIDAIHGTTYTQNSTLFPHNIGMAATRNPELVKQLAKITAKEVRASGIRWNFDPVFGVGRNPLWPRFEETFGEDPYLTGELGVAAINGYEEDGLSNPTAVAACIKHYLGYPAPAIGKDRTPAYIPEILLKEIYLPPFEKAVKTGCPTVMVNSGAINGVPTHANKYLLTDLLKKELGFKGFVVTDWEDIIYLYRDHKIAKNNKEAVKIAINAGIDMSMVPFEDTFYNDLIELVKEGEVPMSRINDAVSRILKVKYQLGLFNNPYPEEGTETNFGKEEYARTALQAAQESITLLKNDTIKGKAVLPLSKNSKILLAGPGANSLATLHGSWSYIWEGVRDDLYPESTLTIREAIENKIGKNNIITVAPERFDEIKNSHISLLKGYASQCDAIILCLGENSYAETNGNMDDLELPDDQLQLALAAIETGKPVILVLTEGRPLIINKIEPGIHGVLQAYRPGSKGAEAISNILFGDYNPEGVLPYSYPQHTGNIVTYDAPGRAENYYNPQWPFGYGLSYTTFKIEDLKISNDTLSGNTPLTVSVKVTNTGNIDGKLAIDLYTRDLVASLTPASKKLKRFTKTHLKAGESKTVKFALEKNDFSFINSNMERITEEGVFEVLVSNHSGRKVSEVDTKTRKVKTKDTDAHFLKAQFYYRK